jgi:zinc protease
MKRFHRSPHPRAAPRPRRARAVFPFIVALAIAALSFSAPSIRGPRAAAAPRAGGGPEILFAGGGSADVVCIAIAVPVGSTAEPPGMRGACHFVEHLAFNGSERFTREEMSQWVDDNGVFLNAFTRKETTVYFLVAPSSLFEEGLELLSQMLIHSVFPASEIEKERMVILEELRREADDPRSRRERIVERALYRGSALAEPIAGHAATIGTMSADALEAFYRRHYDPSRMRIVLMGGYDRRRAAALVEDYFGAPARAACASAGAPSARGASGAPFARGAHHVPRWRNEIVSKPRAGEDPGFDMIIRFPAVPDRDFPAAVLAARLIAGEDSPLSRALAERALGAPEVSLEIGGGYSALRIRLACPGDTPAACGELPALVRALADWKPAPEAVEKAKTAVLAAETFDREMYHFYIMSHGEAIALHGERYLEQITGGVARAGAKDCARALERYFRDPQWNACLLAAPAGATDDAPAGERAVVETLPGGGLAGAARREGSTAAAIHVLLRGRSCAGDDMGPGLVELLMTVLEVSPRGRELVRELEALGARVAFGDNPYVPQDDYLLSPAFAFVRLEAPAARIAAAAGLLGRFLSGDAVTEEALAEARAALMGEIGMRSGSPYYTMRGFMMKALFGDHPFAAPLFPPPPAMAKATADDLRALGAKLFARGNAVATIVSPFEHREAVSILAGLLERLSPGPAVACPAFPDSVAPGVVEKTIRKEGAYLAAGWLVRAASPRETAAALVAGEILARRMQLELREKRGLSYTIDCGVSPVPGGAVVMAYLGTGAARLEEASAALEEEIRGLRGRLPADEEIATAKSRLGGKRTRSELSSINGAYALGLGVLLGGAGAPAPLAAATAAAAEADVRAIIERSLAWERAAVLRLVPEK